MRKTLAPLAAMAAIAPLFLAPSLHGQCSILPDTPPQSRLVTAAAAPASKMEREPNDAAATAMPVTLADMIQAAIDTEGDVDFFAIDLEAGTNLDASVDISGSALYNPTFWLVDRDGVTPLLQHDWESREYRLRYTIATTGRYYLRVGNYRPGTGTYVLRVGRYVAPLPGPGDPITTFWSSTQPTIASLAAGPRGDLFVGNDSGVFRITAARDSTPFVSGIDAEFGVLVDPRGNVFALGCEYPNGAIWRIAPDGARSRFFLGQGTPWRGTIGPDGDIWINDLDSGALWRFDAQGNRKGTMGANWIASHLGFSPAGDLYFTDRAGVYKVVNGAPQLVMPAPNSNTWFDDFAFDRDGYLYVVLVTPYEGGSSQQILQFDPQYRLIQNPFAQVGDHFASSQFADVVFARDAQGRMTRRLLVGRMVMTISQPQQYVADIVELNAKAVRAPGWPIGGPVIRIDDVVSAALGVADVLSPEAKAFLDSQGNHNGVLDIGDVRAYLRSMRP